MYIYGLEDPRTRKVRYVGKASDLYERCWRHSNPIHLKRLPMTRKKSWIISLKKKGLKPIPRVLEECTKETADARERYWIQFFGRSNLVNGTDGGDGGPTCLGKKFGPKSEETRLKISAAKRGKKLRMSARQRKARGQKILAARIKNGTTNKGKHLVFSEAGIANMKTAAIKRGKHMRELNRRKL